MFADFNIISFSIPLFDLNSINSSLDGFIIKLSIINIFNVYNTFLHCNNNPKQSLISCSFHRNIAFNCNLHKHLCLINNLCKGCLLNE